MARLVYLLWLSRRQLLPHPTACSAWCTADLRSSLRLPSSYTRSDWPTPASSRGSAALRMRGPPVRLPAAHRPRCAASKYASASIDDESGAVTNCKDHSQFERQRHRRSVARTDHFHILYELMCRCPK